MLSKGSHEAFETGVLCFFIVSLKRCYDEYDECECVHPLNKDVSQAIAGTFYQCLFQKMVGWVAFKVSLRMM